MNRPTLRTLARLLAPWRTIRRLEKENRRLRIELADERQVIHRFANNMAEATLRNRPSAFRVGP
jgi:hypothetical protein